MATSMKENAAETEKPSVIPDWKKAAEGISLFINNKTSEANLIFSENQGSLTVRSGYAYVVFMDAIMNFEEDKLNLANEVLRDLERECSSQSGWVKNMSRVFGYKQVEPQSLADLLERQIILGDSQLLIGTLTFLQHDISVSSPGIFKGGWALRKAYKIYHRMFNEIKSIYEERIGQFELPDPHDVLFRSSQSDDEVDPFPHEDIPLSNGYTNSKIPHSKSAFFGRKPQKFSQQPFDNSQMKKSTSFTTSVEGESESFWDSFSYLKNISLLLASKDIKADLDISTINRLMSAVCYGYGLLHLGISLLPPSVLRLTQIFGFRTNRLTGLSCLMFARLGEDMRAVLATLTLLWYHTIVRPFYCLDGNNIRAGADAAKILLEESRLEYGESTLFLFFEGRMHRNNSDIQSALNAFKEAVDKATQREIRMLALHEEGWCHIIKLDFQSARVVFVYLKSHSRWSVPFYCFVSLLCTGINDCTETVKQICDIKGSGRLNNIHKSNSLCEYLTKRLIFFDKDPEVLQTYKPIFYKMFLYEMIYMWNALPSCSEEALDTIIQDLESVEPGNTTEEPMEGLKYLLQGACYLIKRDFDKGTTLLRECVALRKQKDIFGSDTHITAFSEYELASVLIRNPETKEEAKNLLLDISRLHNYDFDQKLSVKANSLLKQL